MNVEEIRTYCLRKKGTTEDEPFGPGVLVFKVLGKMFALAPVGAVPQTINLKCDPERAAELRERYEAVTPGYHMNKKHWNTLTLDGSIPKREVLELIDHAYDLVAASLTRADRARLAEL